MSDEFLDEIKQEIEQEKILLLLKKYGLYIFLSFMAILLGGLYYQHYEAQQEYNYQQKSQIFFEQLEAISDEKTHKPALSSLSQEQTYLLLSAKYKKLKEAEDPKAIRAFLKEYNLDSRHLSQGGLPNYAQELFWLLLLQEKIDQKSFPELETDLKDYIRDKGVFQNFAYELLVYKALQDKNKEKATYYLTYLEEKKGGSGTNQERIKAYRWHLGQLL